MNNKKDEELNRTVVLILFLIGFPLGFAIGSMLILDGWLFGVN